MGRPRGGASPELVAVLAGLTDDELVELANRILDQRADPAALRARLARPAGNRQGA